MIKSILLIILLSSCLFAQNNSIRLNPGTIIFDNSIELNYERKLFEKHGIQFNTSIGELFDSDNISLRIGLSYNFYFKEMFKNFYIFPRVSIFFKRYAYEQYSDGQLREYNEDSFGQLSPQDSKYFYGSTIDPGLGIGYRWLVCNRLTFSTGAGAGPSFGLRTYSLLPDRKFHLFLIADVGYVF